MAQQPVSTTTKATNTLRVHFIHLILLTLLCASIFRSISSLPISFFSHKRNFLNDLFVKYAWGWTSLVIGCMHYARSRIHLSDTEIHALSGKSADTQMHSVLDVQTSSIKIDSTPSVRLTDPTINPPFIHSTTPLYSALYRWVPATFIWMLMTQRLYSHSLLDLIFISTGSCSVPHHSFLSCKAQGIWLGFDISGHCFILTHSMLYMLQEIKVTNVNIWPRNTSQKWMLWMQLLVGVLGCLWWWMYAITTLYFHNVFENFVGTAFGILFWYVYHFSEVSLFGEESGRRKGHME